MDRKQWLESRQRGIGSSETPTVLGVNKWDDRRSLAMRKLGLLPLDTEASKPAQRGIALEPIVLDMFREWTGLEVYKPKATEVHPIFPFILRNLDGITPDGETIIEIKCPNMANFAKIRREGADQSYIAQVQHQMLWRKVKRAFLVVFSAEYWEMIDPIEMTPDRELQELILEEDKKFWNMITAGEVPEEEETPPQIDLPATGNSKILKIASQEWLNAIQELQDADSILDEAKGLKEAAKGEILRLMGAYDIAETEGVFRVYNSLQKGKNTIDSKKLQKMFPEAYEKCKKVGQSSRTFRPFWLNKKKGE